jgi:hypothetical protein
MDKVFMCDDRCALAHFLSNHLHVILGTCDLLSEMLSQQTTDPQVMDRLLTIRAAATAMADEITKPLSRAKGA